MAEYTDLSHSFQKRSRHWSNNMVFNVVLFTNIYVADRSRIFSNCKVFFCKRIHFILRTTYNFISFSRNFNFWHMWHYARFSPNIVGERKSSFRTRWAASIASVDLTNTCNTGMETICEKSSPWKCSNLYNVFETKLNMIKGQKTYWLVCY